MTKYKSSGVFQSFKFALRGILASLKSQLNFRIEFLLAIMSYVMAFYLRFTYVELALLTITIALMLFAEMINTVIEFVVDAYFGNKFSVLAKMAKDIAAGAVTIVAILTLLVGVLLFFPKIFAILVFKFR